MPVTQVSIVNSALAKVGQAPVQSLTQDTRAAQIINSIYDLVQDELLSMHPWNFAIKRATLSPTNNTPIYDYEFEYDIPSDCLRMLDNEYDYTAVKPDWQVEGRKLLSNESSLNVRYIARETDCTMWSPTFAEAFAWHLAHKIAYALTQSTEREKMCQDSAKKALSEARTMDGVEGTLRGLQADEWTMSRR
jgi:hypothetical protein